MRKNYPRYLEAYVYYSSLKDISKLSTITERNEVFRKMETTKMRKKSINLDHLPKIYDETKDLGLVAEEIWPLLTKVSHALSADADTKGDFLLYFYENLPFFFKTYQRYAGYPFTAFLVSYFKNLFNNFIRARRRREIREVRYRDSLAKIPWQASLCYEDSIREDKQKLDSLPMESRLLAKLYLGCELSLEELKSLVDTIKSPEKVSDFLTQRRQRKEKEFLVALKRKRLTPKQKIGEYEHLAKFFSISRSTVSRRLEATFFHLREGSV